MEKYIFIESTKERKSGHVPHLLVWCGDYYHEVSLKTGKKLMWGYMYTLEQIKMYGFKVYNLANEKPNIWWKDWFAQAIVDKARGE